MAVPPELRHDEGAGNGAAAKAAASGRRPFIGATLFHELCGALFEHSIDGVLLTQPDGTVLAVNPAACRALGRSEEEIRRLGRGPLVVDDAAFEAFLAERERSGSARAELRYRRADGTPFPVEVSSAVIRTAEGERYTSVIFRDISERKRAEEALARNEAAFEQAAKLARFGTWSVEVVDATDMTANPLRCSDEVFRLFGYEPGERVATMLAWIEHVHADDRARVVDAMTASFAAGGPFAVEYRVRRKDGAERVFVAHGEARFDRAGRPVEMIGAVQDVTEQKRIEQELRDADRRKNEFLAVLSHELRNPLAPIRNSTFILDCAAPGSPQAQRAREIIDRQTEHLTRLVDDLLDVTRISRGKIELARSRVDLRDVVRRTCDDHGSLFERAQLDLRLDVPSCPVWVDADATRLSQAVGNLLANAAKFTPGGGRVAVEVDARDGHAEISVRDTGVGMDPAEIERMFEPFAQGEQGLARTAGGLGLGLALVKGLVELHGGAVRARSDGRGRGSEFLVSLPLALRGDAHPAAQRAGAGRARRVVLVIEDNLDAGESLADVLELAGHRVHLARDGRSGIALAREIEPDVVLCDIGLPDMTGYDVARALREDEALLGTRLVALTGYAQPEDRRRALEAGFAAHLPKPVAIEALGEVLDEG